MSESTDRGFLAEEFGRFFGHERDEPHGVKTWVISTLGPTDVGKTVLISGLYAQYHLGTDHGKPVGIESVGPELHDMLGDISKGLRSRPMRVPDATSEVRNALLKLLVRPRSQTYQKIISLQDHAGEHLRRSSAHHKETIEHLRRSDSFMVLLDSREVLRDDYHESTQNMELNLIKSLIRDISEGLHDEDVIPVAIAFSKSDLVSGQEQQLMEKGMSLFETLSGELKNCVFCFSPVSVIRDGGTEDQPKLVFSPKNIEVPFLFCLASVVVRNALILKLEAERVGQESKDVATQSVAGLGFFKKIAALIGQKVESRRLDSKSKRYFSLSDYDLRLAESACEIINNNKIVTFIQDGVLYHDTNELFSDILR